MLSCCCVVAVVALLRASESKNEMREDTRMGPMPTRALRSSCRDDDAGLVYNTSDHTILV